MTPNESTNQIVEEVADLMKVQLDDKQISALNRLKTNSNDRADTSIQKMHPPITVRFSNQDKRNKFFKKRKPIIPFLRRNVNNSIGSQEIFVSENLTLFRKFLYIEAKKAEQELKHDFFLLFKT